MGYGVVEGEGGSARYIRSGVLRATARRSATERLAMLHAELEELLDGVRPCCVAVESAFHGRNVQALIRLGEARGMVIAAAGARGLPVHDYSPAMVKKSVTGKGNAAKPAVARMVAVALGHELRSGARAPGFAAGGDESDALAVALCHFHRHAILSVARTESDTPKAPGRASPGRVSKAVSRGTAWALGDRG